ncbi:hypothetical protein LEP1GSC065_1479 [Leptospira kirschneri serovar Sokoine str. RM1]|nr:hypothetical protein LEP1GSC065_1479 [Leptospira kirschneri serovar Sokoine str. RM1]
MIVIDLKPVSFRRILDLIVFNRSFVLKLNTLEFSTLLTAHPKNSNLRYQKD